MLSAFQKHTVAQITGLTRDQVDEVIEAIAYVKDSTPAFVGRTNGPHSSTEWNETHGKRDRTARMKGSKGGTRIKVMKLLP